MEKEPVFKPTVESKSEEQTTDISNRDFKIQEDFEEEANVVEALEKEQGKEPLMVGTEDKVAQEMEQVPVQPKKKKSTLTKVGVGGTLFLAGLLGADKISNNNNSQAPEAGAKQTMVENSSQYIETLNRQLEEEKERYIELGEELDDEQKSISIISNKIGNLIVRLTSGQENVVSKFFLEMKLKSLNSKRGEYENNFDMKLKEREQSSDRLIELARQIGSLEGEGVDQ